VPASVSTSSQATRPLAVRSSSLLEDAQFQPFAGIYRTIMLDEMYQDYVRTAFAKGATQRTVLFKHVLKNAMIPVLTNVILTIPFLYTGNLLLETFFVRAADFGWRAIHVPLVFHPGNTPLSDLPGPTGVEILKTIAAARLILSNIPHIKAYWVMLGMKLAQTALHFGANDLEGTIVAEKIAHQAGAETAVGVTRQDLEQLILSAGLRPVERDTFHQAIKAA